MARGGISKPLHAKTWRPEAPRTVTPMQIQYDDDDMFGGALDVLPPRTATPAGGAARAPASAAVGGQGSNRQGSQGHRGSQGLCVVCGTSNMKQPHVFKPCGHTACYMCCASLFNQSRECAGAESGGPKHLAQVRRV